MEPLETTALYPPLLAELLTLLRQLPPDAWDRPTVAGAWRVRNVVGHLLDVDLRRLAGARDRHFGAARPATPAYGDIVVFLNELNASGVGYADRLSPRLLVDLLEITGRWVAEYFASLPPHGEAVFAVSWADEERSEHWMDIGRDYTERWHHQMQIRDAVGAPGLFARQWFAPLLDLSVRAFPRAFKGVDAEIGTAVLFDVDGEEDYVWSVVRESARWIVRAGRAAEPAASLRTDPDTAWKLLYNALSPDAVRARVTVSGDAALVRPLMATRSVMV